MPLYLYIEPGGEYLLPFAKKKLAALHEYMKDNHVDSVFRCVYSDPSAGVFIKSLAMPKGEYIDHVRIKAGVGRGFVFQPFLRRISTNKTFVFPATVANAIEAFTGGPLKIISGYSDFSSYPHVRGPLTTVAATGPVVGATGSGVFSNGAFSQFKIATAGYIAAIVHQYITDPAVGVVKRIIQLLGLSIKDSTTGADLSTAGSVWNTVIGFTSSDDGRTLLLQDSNRAFYNVAVDLASTTNAVSTRIVDTLPYGSDQTFSQVVATATLPLSQKTATTTHSFSATYPVVYGVDSAGVQQSITATEAHTESTSDFYSISRNTSGPSEVDTNSQTNSISISETKTLALPNGNKKTFVTKSQTLSAAGGGVWNTNPGVYTSIDGTYSNKVVTGAINLLYVDPVLPILVYEYVAATLDAAASGGMGTSPNAQTLPWSGVTVTTREVGILYGDKQRVLYTDTSSPVASSGTYPAMDVSNQSYNNSGPTSTNTNIVTNAWVNAGVVRQNAATGFLQDVFSFVAHDVNNWVLSASRVKDMDGNAVSDFRMYAGAIDENDTVVNGVVTHAGLRTNYLNYLAKALSSFTTPDDQAIADMKAGTVSDYEIRATNQTFL
jgi:hypothetical protein